MSRPTSIKALLDEYRSRLSLDGSSIVLTSDKDTADTVERWCKESSSYVPSTTVMMAERPPVDAWPYNEDYFTHIFAHLPNDSKTTLQYLKWLQWSLRYKGIAILTLSDDFNLDHDKTVDFIENASFERGRIRVLERKDSTRMVIAMKWDLLSA